MRLKKEREREITRINVARVAWVVVRVQGTAGLMIPLIRRDT